MRAIIIERWSILRHGLRTVVAQAGHQVVDSVGTGIEGLTAARAASEGRGVDLVVAGMTDDRRRSTLVTELLAAAPGVRVLVLVDNPERGVIDALLTAGVAGILGRVAEGAELVDAIERIGRGERALSNEVIDALLGDRDLEDLAPPPASDGPLTARELEVLGCVGQGLTNRDIAAQLFIGEATVKTHLASIYTKLAVSSRHRAVARSLELGLLERRHGSERRAQARGLAADGVH